MRRRNEQHELVAADRHLEQPLFRGVKCEGAEVETALLDLNGNLAGRHAAHVGRDVGVALAEPGDERQQRVDRRLVRADEHPAAAQVAQVAHGRFGFFSQAHEPMAVVLEHLARFGERAGLRRPIEQLLAELGFEPPDGLAHRGLRPMHLGGRAREASLLGHGQEDLQGIQVHGAHKISLFFGNYYHFDF